MTRSRFLTFTLSIVLLAFSVTYADETAVDTKSAPSNDTVESYSKRMREFFREGYRPPSQTSEEAKKMNDLINKINAMSLSRQKLQQMQDAKAAEMEAQAELLAPVPTTQPVEQAKVEEKRETLSDELLNKICKQAGEEMANPIRLADTLYTSGYKKEAYTIYKNSFNPNISSNDASWITFQMANCLVETDPGEARKLLKKLVTEHPSSPWSLLAENQELILQWRYEYKPRKVLKESRDILSEKIELKEKALPRTDGQTSGSGRGPQVYPLASQSRTTNSIFESDETEN